MDSTLFNTQISAGAIVHDEGSPRCPPVLHFGDPVDEYTAAAEQAAIFDLTDRTQLEISGADRAKFLHNFCTNEIKKLSPGDGCEAFLTNVKARVLGHGFFFVHQDSIWLNSSPNQQQAVTDHLSKYIITEDVVITDRSAEFGNLFVTGKTAAECLGAAGADVSSLSPGQHTAANIGNHTVEIARVDLCGGLGFLISVQVDVLTDIWHALTAVSVMPAGSLAFEAHRIAARSPFFGLDISDEFLAPEIGRNDVAINYTKGCYLGQEPIARLDAMGHVNRELRGLRFESAEPLQANMGVQANGKVIGQVSSVAQIPGTNSQVALAVIRTAGGKCGDTVQIGDLDAEVF